MSAAVDVFSSKSSSLNFSQPLGRQAGPEATGVMRAGLRAICSSGDEAVVLQQVIYWTRVRETEWVQLSASYLGNPLCIPSRTVGECFSRLAEKGFISSRQRSPGEAKWHCVDADAILEALAEAGFEANADQLFGHPCESRDPPSQDSQPPPSRNLRQKEQQNKEDSKDCEADGHERGRKADDTSDDSITTTPLQLSNLEQYVREAFETWSVSDEQAQTIRETLAETFGLSNPEIRAWIGERAADFTGRSRQLSRREVVRYTTSRQDLVDRGYLRPMTVAPTVDEEPTDPTSADDVRKDEADQRFFTRANELLDEMMFEEAVDYARAEAREKGWRIPEDWKEPTDE